MKINVVGVNMTENDKNGSKLAKISRLHFVIVLSSSAGEGGGPPLPTISSPRRGEGLASALEACLGLRQGLPVVLDPVVLKQNGGSVQQAGCTPSADKVQTFGFKRCCAMGGNQTHALHHTSHGGKAFSVPEGGAVVLCS